MVKYRDYINELTSDVWYIRSDGLISLAVQTVDKLRIEKILYDLEDINYEL